jgi:hypothetical protein
VSDRLSSRISHVRDLNLLRVFLTHALFVTQLDPSGSGWDGMVLAMAIIVGVMMTVFYMGVAIHNRFVHNIY